MENLAIICGGNSLEREISILSGLKIYKELRKNDVYCILIEQDIDHNFYLIEEVDEYYHQNKKKKGYFIKKGNNNYFKIGFKKYYFEQVFLLVHGKNVEDGTLKSYFDNINIPCLSEDLYNGGIIQNKLFFKYFLSKSKISYIQYQKLYKYEYQNKIKELKNEKYPLIVKPSKLGSSIAINRVNNHEELIKALEEAFLYDDLVLIERYIERKKEYNIALLGYQNEIEFSNIEEVNDNDSILSFYDKYDYSKNNKKRIISPSIDFSIEEKIKKTSRKIFEELNLCGIIRFDFIFDLDNNHLYINEVNLIPGSLSYYLFADKFDIVKLIEKDIHYLKIKQKNEQLLLKKFQEGFIEKIELSKLKK